MKKPSKKLVLIIFFTVSTLISIIVTYTLHQIPTQETKTNTLCTYSSTATYDYTATLEPNMINDNRTTLKPNEGTLYVAVTKQIDITLTYTFQATLPTNAEITYSAIQSLKTAAWQHPVARIPQTTTNQTQIQLAVLPFNKTELEATKKQIETETGTSSNTYAFEMAPTFIVNANTSAGSIHQTFTPTLTIDLERTDEGYVITIDSLQQTKANAITEDQTIIHSETINQRYASYVFLAISTAGLGFSIYFFKKGRPTTRKSPLEKLIAPYKDLIIEAKESPKIPQETTIIDIESMEELAKTSEILARPMIHTKNGKEHTFYIIDSNTRYQYKTTEEQT
jgi:hypothetical protein